MDVSSSPLFVVGECRVPPSAVRWEFSRAGGPGGQHVNRTESRATAVLTVSGVDAPDQVRDRLLECFGPILRVSCASSRSQWRNREEALELMTERVRDCLRSVADRRPTRVPLRAKLARSADKRRRSAVKSLRRDRPQW